jgi:excisionase family DNA binding protein
VRHRQKAGVTKRGLAEGVLGYLDQEAFATVPEICAVTRYGHQTVLRAIHQGEIPAQRIGGTFRVPVAWLREFIAMGETREPVSK